MMDSAFLAVLLTTLHTPVVADSSNIGIGYHRAELSNGLTVLIHEDHTTPLVAVDTWHHVGAAHERPGRRGFAHLFEHVITEGSKHVPLGDRQRLLEEAGARSNASVGKDSTNYYATVPTSALDLVLFIESDRMAYFLEGMTQQKLDQERDIVKNERRQRRLNVPYGLAWEWMDHLLYPPDHPYHLPVEGEMEDLEAADLDDVSSFFHEHYAPANAVLVIAGAVDTEYALERVRHWFSEVPSGTRNNLPVVPTAELDGPILKTIEDDVQLPRLYMAWRTPPFFHPGDADLDVAANILGQGKRSRLYQRLVYDLQIAQDVDAWQHSFRLSSKFVINVTARPGQDLDQIRIVIDEELDRLRSEPPSRRDLERVYNAFELNLFHGLQEPFQKAEALNSYLYYTGNPDYAHEDLARFQALDPDDISNAVTQWLRPDRRAVLSYVPRGQAELGVSEAAP